MTHCISLLIKIFKIFIYKILKTGINNRLHQPWKLIAHLSSTGWNKNGERNDAEKAVADRCQNNRKNFDAGVSTGAEPGFPSRSLK